MHLMKVESLFKHAAIVGVFAIALYAACLLWRFSMSDPMVAQFHLLALKTAFPGFNGFDTGSMVLGGVLSFIYGFLASLIFHILHGACNCKMMKKGK